MWLVDWNTVDINSVGAASKQYCIIMDHPRVAPYAGMYSNLMILLFFPYFCVGKPIYNRYVNLPPMCPSSDALVEHQPWNNVHFGVYYSECRNELHVIWRIYPLLAFRGPRTSPMSYNFILVMPIRISVFKSGRLQTCLPACQHVSLHVCEYSGVYM